MATGEGARGAAALLAGAELRGGAWPEYAVSGVPGAIWDGLWPWRTIVAWVIHWRAQVRGFGARSWPAAVQGGPGSPACRMLAPRGRYGLQHLAQKIRGVGVLLTVPRIERESGAAGLEVRYGGAAWTGVRGGGRCRGRSRGRRSRGGSWRQGGAPAVLARAWEAAGQRIHGGALSSARRSCVARRVRVGGGGFGVKMRCRRGRGSHL